jgi:hypothetical protein
MPKLKRWEYCALWLYPAGSSYKLELKNLEPFENHQPSTYEQGVETEQAIARLGLDGWEMITFHFLYQEHDPTEVYYFKRQIWDDQA